MHLEFNSNFFNLQNSIDLFKTQLGELQKAQIQANMLDQAPEVYVAGKKYAKEANQSAIDEGVKEVNKLMQKLFDDTIKNEQQLSIHYAIHFDLDYRFYEIQHLSIQLININSVTKYLDSIKDFEKLNMELGEKIEETFKRIQETRNKLSSEMHDHYQKSNDRYECRPKFLRLVYAINTKNKELLRYFSNHGDLNILGPKGETALSYAMSKSIPAPEGDIVNFFKDLASTVL